MKFYTECSQSSKLKISKHSDQRSTYILSLFYYKYSSSGKVQSKVMNFVILGSVYFLNDVSFFIYYFYKNAPFTYQLM
jgi:hypothetical protein